MKPMQERNEAGLVIAMCVVFLFYDYNKHPYNVLVHVSVRPISDRPM